MIINDNAHHRGDKVHDHGHFVDIFGNLSDHHGDNVFNPKIIIFSSSCHHIFPS